MFAADVFFALVWTLQWRNSHWALCSLHREACSERAAAAMGLVQLPGEEEAGPADMVLPNKEAEACCFFLEMFSPAQVCFVLSKHFQGKLCMKSHLCSRIHCIKSRVWV